jgi:hypothetical protein
MPTTYFAELRIPGHDERAVLGPVDSARALADMYAAFVRRITERSLAAVDEDDRPMWRPYAEEDGVERFLTDDELADLLEDFERMYGYRFFLVPTEEQ